MARPAEPIAWLIVHGTRAEDLWGGAAERPSNLLFAAAAAAPSALFAAVSLGFGTFAVYI